MELFPDGLTALHSENLPLGGLITAGCSSCSGHGGNQNARLDPPNGHQEFLVAGRDIPR